jgi:DNA-binding response OmpR family regulator
MVSFLLREENYTVSSISQPVAALELIENEQPDLVILDVMMPRLDGLELTQRIRQISSVPILILSAKGQVADKVSALSVGADDYMAKPFEPAELLARVKAIIRRSSLAASLEVKTKLNVGDVEINTVEGKVRIKGQPPKSLTPTEMRLLYCLMRNAGRILTRDVLRQAVWEYDYEGDSNGVDVYVKRLRTKLESDPSTPKLIITVRGYGYKFVQPAAALQHE